VLVDFVQSPNRGDRPRALRAGDASRSRSPALSTVGGLDFPIQHLGLSTSAANSSGRILIATRRLSVVSSACPAPKVPTFDSPRLLDYRLGSFDSFQKEVGMRKAALLLVWTLVVSLAVPIVAQDAVEVDPDHYSVVFENEKVRVIRIAYGPGEKSVMHYHPAGVAVFLTDAHVKFILPDGESAEMQAKAGETAWTEAGSHQPENVSDEALELIQVEMKE
jgi:quercetin dioxygenase-like cupin family protein